ncbi:MAG: glycosyl transferase [Ignavibacteriae bacterium HGW-Ignavibacteriae-3]|nr:MAG: glycosyl transferase [Ignavibacteriae bacterium HGW-Ignavibacteriae-3]
MFEIIFLVSVSIYFIQLFVFSIGAGRKYPKLPDEQLPTVTVVVAARDEEKNILDCIKSLDKLIYPEGKLEIIIVNDHSTDKTDEIIESFIKDKPRFKKLIPVASIGSLRGKTNALANAIKIATGEIILTTDADCMVSPTWAKTLASYYKEDVAFAGGFTSQEDYNTFAGMQAIDFVYLLAVAGGTINLGKPLSCIGNNMSYRRSVYDEIGGYEGLPFSVTEDFNLLMAVHDLKKYKIIYPLDVDSLVISKVCPDWKTLYWQKKRWGVGGMKSDLIGYSVMAWGYIVHGMMLMIPFFFSPAVLYLSVFKILIDYYFVKPVFNKLKLKMRIKHFLAFELYFIIYVLILPFIVLPNRKVKWKGRTF